MLQTLWTARKAILATALLIMAAGPAFAQREYRGGYQDASGKYHGGNEDFGYPYNGGYYPAYGYYPTDPVLLARPYYPRYMSPGVPSYYYSQPSTSYYYTPTVAADPTATIQVRVPANAKVWFDDEPTRSTGEQRIYSSPPLESGKTYHYTVRVRWENNGKMTEKSQSVEVHAGKQTDVDFTQK